MTSSTAPWPNAGYGPIINDTSGQATTIQQIGGAGIARWKQLCYGAHLQGAWNTVEHVTLLPGASIGEHVHDRTEEIYYILSGRAEMRMNAEVHQVRAGDLITTPIGARHAIENSGDDDMVFYVTEVFPGTEPPKAPRFLTMAESLESVAGFRDSPAPVLVSGARLTDTFTGPWRAFHEIRLAGSQRLGHYTLPDVAEVVFVVSGDAAVTVEGTTYSGSVGLCVALPVGARRSIENLSASDELRLISTEVLAA